jgi:nucleotide-binding universal stress UspA family protein
MGLAAPFAAEVVVAHAWDQPSWFSETMMVRCDSGPPRPLGTLIWETEHRHMLQFLASLPGISAADLQQRVLSGDPVSAVLTELDRGGYDLCVVSTHGRGGLKRLLLGSVTEKLVRMAKVPVLTVPPPQLSA